MALLDQFRFPYNRAVDDWPGVARALVRAARGFGLDVPHYLAWSAGFREPPPPLRLVRGGKGDADIGDIERQPFTAEADDDLGAWEAALEDRTYEGGAMIFLGGVHPPDRDSSD